MDGSSSYNSTLRERYGRHDLLKVVLSLNSGANASNGTYTNTRGEIDLNSCATINDLPGSNSTVPLKTG